MAGNSKTTIIVGVGDVRNRSQKVEDAVEPMQLMLQAIMSALEDTGLSPSSKSKLQSSIDSVDVVATWTWPYHDLPGLISQNLGIQPGHKRYSEHGGNQPMKLVDEAARRISQGESRVAIVTGGEALASCDAKTLEQLSSKSKEPIGRSGWVKKADCGRNLFIFEANANL
ncbi:hypothetical protein P7C71_g5465, partial [Lecanoromycetidae sp. Uapishka_2]